MADQILNNIEGGMNDLYGASPLTNFASSKDDGIEVAHTIDIREDGTIITAITHKSGSSSKNFIGEELQKGDIIVLEEGATAITFSAGSAWVYTANKKK